MQYDNILAALDMLGCPNRCRHCFVGWRQNPKLVESDLRWAAEEFRPWAKTLTVYDWNREPDFGDDYKERWELCRELSSSDTPPEHYELASVWRLARDGEYAPWLKSLDVKYVQLTLFGGEELTDYFTGREGAYQDIFKAIDVLLENGIAPRIQVFANQKTVRELHKVTELIDSLELEKRCEDIGVPFACFVHQGSCDGEGEKLYPIWITSEDLEKIPDKLVQYTLKHFNKPAIRDVFGQEEQELYDELINDHTTESLGSTAPAVLYIDGEFNVTPNIGVPAEPWRLGNLKKDGAEMILSRLMNDESPAQRIRATVPLSELVRVCGAPDSRRLFGRDDYIEYLLSRYCRRQDV